MNKMPMFCATTLLCSLLAVQPAIADRHDDWDTQYSSWRHHEQRHDLRKINYLREQLERSKAERRKVEWAYDQARRVGDWPTVRFQQARLDRLDQKIRKHQHDLHRTYQQARWDRHHEAWRGKYGYEYHHY